MFTSPAIAAKYPTTLDTTIFLHDNNIIRTYEVLRVFIYTGIGTEVEQKRNAVVERERQKAIRSTEEVVRREEEAIRLEVSWTPVDIKMHMSLY